MDPYELKSLNDVVEPGQRIAGYERFAIFDVRNEVVAGSLTEEHAQLLACLHPLVQKRALDGLLTLDDVPSAPNLRHMIEDLAVNLESQSFDKADCRTCRYNSSNHANLFDHIVATGLCVNASCASARSNREEGAVASERNHSVDKEHDAQDAVGAQGDHSDHLPEPTSALSLFRLSLWRHALIRHVLHLPDGLRPSVVLALAGRCKALQGASNGCLEVKAAPSLEEAVKAALSDEPMSADEALKKLLIRSLEAYAEGDCRVLLKTLAVELGHHWVMTDSFFGRLTPQQMIDVWREMGLTWTEQMQQAVEQGTHRAVIKETLSQYDLNGFVPSILAY